MSTPTMLLLSQVVYVGLGVATFAHWAARRGGERFDIALMFASMALATRLEKICWICEASSHSSGSASSIVKCATTCSLSKRKFKRRNTISTICDKLAFWNVASSRCLL